MAINQIGLVKNLSSISGIKPIREGIGQETRQEIEGNTGQGFKQIFNSLIDSVEQTEAVKNVDAYKLSVGEIDDLHNMMINSARAEVALQTAVQIRNKVLDAYNEIMRINL